MEITLFRGKCGNKKETVTDTFVSITVSVLAKVPQVDTMHSLTLGCTNCFEYTPGDNKDRKDIILQAHTSP